MISVAGRVSPSDSVDPAEIARFAEIAESWWDPLGSFRPLHQLNPTRLAFIRDHLAGHFGRDTTGSSPFAGFSLLDIGCGGGLVAEPLTRLGARVTGIDAGTEAIGVARSHAMAEGLAIDYRVATAEAMVAEGAVFDVVLALEVVEHVADPADFVASVGRLVRPGGAVVFSTLNRTAKSFAFGIVGAEYLLRWLPRGTHSWSKFRRPSELAADVRAAGLEVRALTGMQYNPLSDRWSLGADLGFNYLMFAVAPPK